MSDAVNLQEAILQEVRRDKVPAMIWTQQALDMSRA